MKKRSLSGNVGIGIFIVAFICIVVAFATPSWLVSDYRITNSRLHKLGLWTHCFKSLPDPLQSDAPTRWYVGCRWVYDPFTTGYSEIRGYLLPPFMVATQVFFTMAFISMLVSFVLLMLYALCCDPEQKHYVKLVTSTGYLCLFAGISGCIAVIIFASLGNTKGWMIDQENNYFGWSFAIGVIGSVLALIASLLLLIEANIQHKKRKYLKESQTRFQLEPSK